MTDNTNKSKSTSMNNYKIPGMKGPRNRQEVEKAENAGQTLKRLVKYFGREKVRVITLFVEVILICICSVFAPRLQSNAIDTITLEKYEELTPILVTILGIYGVHALLTWIQSRNSAKLSQNIVKCMREDLFSHMVKLPIKYLDTHSHGDIMSRMTNDVENISNTLSESLCSLVSGVITVVATAAMMFYLCPQLAILSCFTIIITIVATKALSKAMRKYYRKRQSLLGNLNGTVEEMVGGYKTVVAYNRQDEVIAEFDKTSDELTKTGILAETIGNSMGPLMNAINNFGFVIIAAFGGYFAINGIISVGLISAFIVYAKQFGRPIDEIAQVYGQIQTAIAGAERVFSIMDEDLENNSGSLSVDNESNTITFKNVNFSYESGKRVLCDFNFEFEAGHKVALVGSTGSGKTTVVNLLMRFYDVDSGEILINGVNIKDISRDRLRENIAIVLQDTVLFADTIRNNLMYSNENASEELLDEATKTSNCYEMIQNMPKGYDTMLSAAGQNISQGQRQLLSIARAFLAQPKILILDEATSSVDTRTEKKIQDAMVKLMKNRTSLIIAHRLSTIQDADCIVVLESGRIVETGNHKQLLEKRGKYYELYMTQFAGNAT